MRFEIRIGAAAEGGRVAATHDSLTIENADAVTLVLVERDQLQRLRQVPVREGRDAAALASRRSARGARQAVG